MKTEKIGVSFIFFMLFFTLSIHARQRVVEADKISRINHPNKAGEFQVHVHFALPRLPAGAELVGAVFVLDQQFEIMIDSTQENPQQRETPKGFVNKTRDGITVSAYGIRTLIPDQWTDIKRAFAKKASTRILPQQEIIQEERQSGNRANEVVQFDVRRYLRGEFKEGKTNVVFIIGGARPNEDALKMSEIDADINSLSARLVLTYVEEPQTPPRIRRK